TNVDLASKLSSQLLDRYQDSPLVLRALVNSIGIQHELRQEVLHAYIKLSPDAWAYQALAGAYLKSGQIDRGQTLLDEYLSQQPDDEQATNVRVEMANVFVTRGEWEKALPYVEAAASKNSEAGMAALIRCYQGLGD